MQYQKTTVTSFKQTKKILSLKKKTNKNEGRRSIETQLISKE